MKEGSWYNIEDINHQVTEPALEVSIGLEFWTLDFGPHLLTYVPLGIG